jgi:hypothetical protein
MTDAIFSKDPFRDFRTLDAIYAGVVTEFTRKKLSFPLDILNAFSGVATTMEKLYSWRMIAGLPESLLVYALLWLPHKPSPCRCQDPGSEFPNWSWTGWSTEVDYDLIVRKVLNFEPYTADMESLVHWLQVYDRDGLRNACDRSSIRGDALDETTSGPNQNLIQGEVFLWVNAYLPGSLFGFRFGIISIIQCCRCEIVFLSIVMELRDDLAIWDTSRTLTNFMLVQLKGDFAEWISLGEFRGMIRGKNLSSVNTWM